MKIYIAGKITGYKGYKAKFKKAEELLESQGHVVMNPSFMKLGFEYGEYLHVCYAMIDVCDAIYMLDNWVDSPGAKKEKVYARKNGKKVLYE